MKSRSRHRPRGCEPMCRGSRMPSSASGSGMPADSRARSMRLRISGEGLAAISRFSSPGSAASTSTYTAPRKSTPS